MFELSAPLPLPLARRPSHTPPPSQRLLKRAARHITHKRYEQAITHLRHVMRLGADVYACTLRIADVECRRCRWQAALHAVEQAIALAPEHLTAYEMLMTLALHVGDYTRAIAAGQMLIKRVPRHIATYDALCAIYMQLGDVDAALRVLNTLVRLNGKDPLYHFKKGLLLQHKGEIALAVHAFSTALRLQPDDALATDARESLETLDAFQLNHILTLGMDDAVFRVRLLHDAGEAAAERGFALSEQGAEILTELCLHLLPNALHFCRPMRYN